MPRHRGGVPGTVPGVKRIYLERGSSSIMTTAELTLNVEKAQGLAMKLIGDTTGTLVGALMVIGDRLGLFDTLAAAGSATSEEFAARAGINERYAREWLSAMACQGYVDFD